MLTITIQNEFQETAVHIPNPGQMLGRPITLCGWCDVDNSEHDHTEKAVDCVECIAIFEAIRKMKPPNGYIKKSKR